MSAKDNMKVDEQLAESDRLALRVYPWQQAGITVAYRQECGPWSTNWDVAKRPTGGGVVFHCPGDAMFTCAIPARYLKGMKMKSVLSHLQRLTKNILIEAGYRPETHPASVPSLGFCLGYDNPYEWSVTGRKAVGLALRRRREWWLVQGLFYVGNAKQCFESVGPDYHPFLSEGVGGSTALFLDQTERVFLQWMEALL